MPSSYTSDRIRHIQNDISRIQGRIADISRDEARASEKIASATRNLTRASSVSQAESYARDVQRNQDDVARLQRKRADEAQNLARKQEEFARAQQDFFREQEQEFKKSQDVLKRLEDEARQRQNDTISAIRAASLISASPVGNQTYSAFICHASEDKGDVVRPLADALVNLGHQIWYDDFALKVGDSLRRSIDRGLAAARFGIVVLSPAFFAKNWPQYELDGLVAKEQAGQKVILPLWHRVSKNDVLGYSPTLADRVALNTAMFTIQELAEKLHEVLSTP